MVVSRVSHSGADLAQERQIIQICSGARLGLDYVSPSRSQFQVALCSRLGACVVSAAPLTWGLRAKALAILAGDEEGFDHLGVYEVAVELIQLA